jgi:uncharacterized cofD-like protein
VRSPIEQVVALGGGHGLARALRALRELGLTPTAVVTVADDGGSSGRLRRDLGIIAPGDLRMALLNLARNEELARVLGHRFERGELEGHAVGNLLLVALAELADGDFVAALDHAGALLDCAGRVLPSTTAPVQLMAKVAGREVNGQANVASTYGHVEALWLEPQDPPACAEAVRAIAAADLVVLGPGSLFTSVIATLLVPGIAAALTASRARKVYVGNLLPQAGETSGMDGQAHVDALLERVPGLALDVVIEPAARHGGEVLTGVRPSDRVRRVVTADLAPGGLPRGHNPERLAAVLASAEVTGAPAPER